MKTDLKLLPGILQWKIGNKKVTVINDSHFTAGEGYLTNLHENGIADFLHESYRPETPTLTTNVFLLESEDHAPVLIDAGMGNKLSPDMNGHLLEALHFIGLKPEEIGTVLLTHLHGDHYYGLMSQNGEKSFPNAKIWVSDLEEHYWMDSHHTNSHDVQNAIDARESLDLYDRLEVSENKFLKGITPVPLPGHTPGHTGFLLESEGEKVLFCADILTIPAIQSVMPEIGFATDADHTKAVNTRKEVLQKAAHERLLLAGPHFEFPCLSYVKVQGDGYALIPKQWLS